MSARKKTTPLAIQPPLATKIMEFAFAPLAKNDVGELIRKIFKENASCHG
jgi:hypothetical protein